MTSKDKPKPAWNDTRRRENGMPMNKTERLWRLADVMGRNIIWTRKFIGRWEREIDSLGAFLKYTPVEQTIGRREALVLKLQAVVDMYQALIDKLEE